MQEVLIRISALDLTTDSQEPMSLQVSTRRPSSVKQGVMIIVFIIIIIIIGTGLFAWYTHHPSLTLHKVPVFCTSHGSPGSPYMTLP